MNSKLLIATSALALMLAPVSYAQTKQPDTKFEKDVDVAKEIVSDAVDDAKEGVKETYENIKAALITEDEKTSGLTHVEIDMRMTAAGILDKPIYNMQNEKIGDVADIILDSHGKAGAVIVAHGGFLSIGGKDAAFDYDLVMRRDSSGDVVIPVSKETISTAKEFSYDRTEKSDKIRVIAKDAVSLKALLKGKVYDYNDKSAAHIDNIFFKDGSASQVIISFDKTLGMGGEKAVMDFNALELVHKGAAYYLKMNKNQSIQFERFAKSLKK